VYQRVTPKLLPPKNISKLSLGRKRSWKASQLLNKKGRGKRWLAWFFFWLKVEGGCFAKNGDIFLMFFCKNTISQIPVPFLMPENLSKHNKNNVSKTTFLLIQIWNSTTACVQRKTYVTLGCLRWYSPNGQNILYCKTMIMAEYFLGGGFKHSLFSSLLGEDSQFD